MIQVASEYSGKKFQEVSKNLQYLLNRYNYDPNHNLRYLALKEIVESYKIQELLVLGCGKGILESILTDSIKCISVDIDPHEIYIAQEINLGKRNRFFIHANIFDIEKKLNKRFNIVLISEVLEHLENDKKCIKMVKNLLKPNGIFILTVPNVNRLINKIRQFCNLEIQFMSDTHKREYTRQKIIELLNTFGFNVIREKYVYLRFPKEELIRKIIPVDCIFRKLVLSFKPTWANYLIFSARVNERKNNVV